MQNEKKNYKMKEGLNRAALNRSGQGKARLSKNLKKCYIRHDKEGQKLSMSQLVLPCPVVPYAIDIPKIVVELQS